MTPSIKSSFIEARNLEVGFQKKQVLKGVSFSISAGSICVLLGPNGAGKSTLLRTLVGLMKPLAGEVLFESKNSNQLSDQDRAQLIAWIPQDESTEFGWRAEEYVALGRVAKNQSLFETADDLKMVETALEQTSSLDLKGRSITEMSGGERQRIRLARAIAQETPILALDEPSTHLDVGHQLELLALLKQFRSQGKTIVVSMHDLNQALSIGDQFLLVSSQKVQIFLSKYELIKSNELSVAFGVKFQQIPSENHPLIIAESM
jgi:iron complex transport system ATP-binding protein